jgi:hypothetical protein
LIVHHQTIFPHPRAGLAAHVSSAVALTSH